MSDEAGAVSTAKPLDRDSPLPLWAQLEAELRRRVDLGHFGDRFPTDLELTELYEVSRHTVRHALSQLGADGIVKRQRGRGTTVSTEGFEQSLGALYSLFQLVESSGASQTSRVLRLQVCTDPDIADQLNLSAGAELVRLDRLRLADAEPLALDRVWLPLEIGRPLLDSDFGHTALYDELERTVKIRPNQGWERITPVMPSESDARLLDLPDGIAAFSLERLGCFEDRPIEWRVTMIRGDRFSFLADWSAGKGSELRLNQTD